MPAAGLALLALAAAEAQVPQTQSPAPATPPPSAGAAQPAIAGVWIDHTGQGAVELKACGTRVCGHVVWMQKATDEKGQPRLDRQNADKARRALPMCGLQIIGDATPNGSGTYDKGWIYNPEDGATYDVDLKPRGRDQLLVHGFLGMRFLGETFTWTRAPDTLVRCKA